MAEIKLQVTVREDFARWINEGVERPRFASRSHAVEFALMRLKDREDKRGKNRTTLELAAGVTPACVSPSSLAVHTV